MRPTILVYHDLLGAIRGDDSQNPNRKHFCRNHRLIDATDDGLFDSEKQERLIEDPVAEAKFFTLHNTRPSSNESDAYETPGSASEQIMRQWDSDDKVSLLLLGLRAEDVSTRMGELSPSPKSQSDSSAPYGLQVLRRIRDRSSSEDLPVIVMASEETVLSIGEEDFSEIRDEVKSLGGELIKQDNLDLKSRLDRDENHDSTSRDSKTITTQTTEQADVVTSIPNLHTRTRPRLLVIDDELGRRSREGWKSRRSFCKKFGVRDVTGDPPPDGLPEIEVESPIAEAVFCNGQKEINGRLENDMEGTLETIRSGWPDGISDQPRWSLLLLDLHFKTGPLSYEGEPEGRPEDRDPDNYFGLRVLEEIWEDEEFTYEWQPQSQASPEQVRPPVVLFSAMDREEIESRFARPGVYSFIERPDLNDSSGSKSYQKKLDELLQQHGLIDDERIIGRSLPLLDALRQARRRATSGQENVLLLGESGTGKELLGPYMHRHSRREGDYRAFIAGNVSEENIPQQLFGAEPIFAGMEEVKVGDAELADEGTLFIDEFADVKEATQERLKRLLDLKTRSFQRVGGTETIGVDLLVIGATNDINITEKALDDLIWRRMKAHDPVELPALRQRKEDIRLLTEYFVRNYEDFYDAERRNITEETFELLEAQDWRKGNVGNLENTIRQAINVYGDLRELNPSLLQLPETGEPSSSTVSSQKGPAERESQPPEHRQPTSKSLETLVEKIESFDPTELRIGELRGHLLPLHRSYYRLLARLINRALEVKKREDGEYRYTNSMRLLGGDLLPDDEATTLKRYIERLLKLDKRLDSDLEFLSDIIDDLPHLRTFLDEGPDRIQKVLDGRTGPSNS